MPVFASAAELSAALGVYVKALVDAKGAAAGPFTVAVSGGSLPKLLGQALAATPVDLAGWKVYLVDERIVPLDHADSNYAATRKALPDLPAECMVPIAPELAPEACAQDYAAKVTAGLGASPVFDLVLLGMGPDGHTASLFPDHALLNEKDKVVAAITDSPKPPPQRVTLTLPVINAARNVAFVVTGEGKQGALVSVLEENKLPSSLIKPSPGKLTWFLDAPAAAKLTKAKASI